MTKNTPSGAKKHRESTELESHQTAKMFFFFIFFFFFFFFRRASSNLRDSFTMVFAQNSSVFTEQCTSLSLFSSFEVTRGDLNRSLKNSSVHNSTLHIFDVGRYVGWGCILNCFMQSSLPCFCFLLICYPYILLYSECFFVLVHVTFLAADACLS